MPNRHGHTSINISLAPSSRHSRSSSTPTPRKPHRSSIRATPRIDSKSLAVQQPPFSAWPHPFERALYSHHCVYLLSARRFSVVPYGIILLLISQGVVGLSGVFPYSLGSFTSLGSFAPIGFWVHACRGVFLYFYVLVALESFCRGSMAMALSDLRTKAICKCASVGVGVGVNVGYHRL